MPLTTFYVKDKYLYDLWMVWHEGWCWFSIQEGPLGLDISHIYFMFCHMLHFIQHKYSQGKGIYNFIIDSLRQVHRFGWHFLECTKNRLIGSRFKIQEYFIKVCRKYTLHRTGIHAINYGIRFLAKTCVLLGGNELYAPSHKAFSVKVLRKAVCDICLHCIPSVWQTDLLQFGSNFIENWCQAMGYWGLSPCK